MELTSKIAPEELHPLVQLFVTMLEVFDDQAHACLAFPLAKNPAAAAATENQAHQSPQRE